MMWLYNNPMMLIFSPFQRWGKQGSERLNDLPKVTVTNTWWSQNWKSDLLTSILCIPSVLCGFLLFPVAFSFESYVIFINNSIHCWCFLLFSFYHFVTQIPPNLTDWLVALIVLHLAAEGETRLDLPLTGPLKYKCTHSDQWQMAT